MLESQKRSMSALVTRSLDRAENTWKDVGSQLLEKRAHKSFDRLDGFHPTAIPGYPVIEEGKPAVGEFVAVVVDMRKSTEHLLCDISPKFADVTLFKRVYYETSALLPAVASAIESHNGSVVEYLGDGILSLFRVDTDDKSKTIYAAHNAAKDCLDALGIVNPILEQRYRLPALDIGIGMALSKAIVTLVGLDNHQHPKAIGECVWRATKLSSGTNQIFIDAALEAAWPRVKGGRLQFRRKLFHNNFFGFLIDATIDKQQ